MRLKNKIPLGVLLLLTFFYNAPVVARSFVVSEQSKTIGALQKARVEPGDTLGSVALRYDIGLHEMVAANPGVPSQQILPEDMTLVIPSFYRLPNTKRSGIVINLAQFRLYFYKPQENIVVTMPISIGKKGWETPLGQTKIIAKVRDPIWRPSTNMQQDARGKGRLLPESFPGGEVNPLGRHALRLGWPSYLIHGSNRVGEIGIAASAGCIRMLPADIAYLYDLVRVGTIVTVVNQPSIGG